MVETPASLGLTDTDLLQISGNRFPVSDRLARESRSRGSRRLLSEASSSSQTIYAAMFEIDDLEIIDLLTQIGRRASIVLSNGGAARTGRPININDAAVRERLRQAGVVVHDRIISAGRLAHNKFMILCDASGEPRTVWTGNASWVRASLCARSNATVTVDSKPLAEAFLAYWNVLAEKPSQADLSRWVGAGRNRVQIGSATVKPWFTPTRNLADLQEVRRYVEQARQGILFLLSDPGREKSLLTTILDQKNLFVMGISRNGPNLTYMETVGSRASRAKILFCRRWRRCDRASAGQAHWARRYKAVSWSSIP